MTRPGSDSLLADGSLQPVTCEGVWQKFLAATREYRALAEHTDERLRELLSNLLNAPLVESDDELMRCLDLAGQVVDAARVHRESLETFLHQRRNHTPEKSRRHSGLGPHNS